MMIHWISFVVWRFDAIKSELWFVQIYAGKSTQKKFAVFTYLSLTFVFLHAILLLLKIRLVDYTDICTFLLQRFMNDIITGLKV